MQNKWVSEKMCIRRNLNRPICNFLLSKCFLHAYFFFTLEKKFAVLIIAYSVSISTVLCLLISNCRIQRTSEKTLLSHGEKNLKWQQNKKFQKLFLHRCKYSKYNNLKKLFSVIVWPLSCFDLLTLEIVVQDKFNFLKVCLVCAKSCLIFLPGF